MDVVNKIKQNELLKWRQQQIAQTEGDFKTCLYQVGAAHLAAEHETEKMKQIDAQRIKNRKLALQRNKLAAEKVKAKRSSTNGKTRVKETQVHTVATQVDDSLSAGSDSDAASSFSSASSVCSVIASRKDNKKISPRKFHSPKAATKSATKNYIAENFISVNSSTSTDISLGIESPVAKFTRVSDLLKKKSTINDESQAPATTAANIESIVTKPYVSKTFKLDTSVAGPRRSPPKKTIIKSVAARAGKCGPTHPASLTVHPIKKKTTISKKMPPIKYNIKPYVPQFIKSKKPTEATATQSATGMAKTTQNVQFYDHSNRFSKEYENKLNLIENYDATAPLNAMQEAELEREREKDYLLEMAKAR